MHSNSTIATMHVPGVCFGESSVDSSTHWFKHQSPSTQSISSSLQGSGDPLALYSHWLSWCFMQFLFLCPPTGHQLASTQCAHLDTCWCCLIVLKSCPYLFVPLSHSELVWDDRERVGRHNLTEVRLPQAESSQATVYKGEMQCPLPIDLCPMTERTNQNGMPRCAAVRGKTVEGKTVPWAGETNYRPSRLKISPD